MLAAARAARATAPVRAAARMLSNAAVKVESAGTAVTARQAASPGPAASAYTPKAASRTPSAFFGGRLFAFLAGFGVGTLCFAMPGFAGSKLLHSEITKNVRGIGADIEESNTELRQRVARLEHELSALQRRR